MIEDLTEENIELLTKVNELEEELGNSQRYVNQLRASRDAVGDVVTATVPQVFNLESDGSPDPSRSFLFTSPINNAGALPESREGSLAGAHMVTTPQVETRKEANKITFPEWPSHAKLRRWKLAFKKKIAGASSKPKLAFIWAGSVETAKSWQELEDGDDDEFETLNAKIGAGLTDIIPTSSDFARDILNLEERLAKEGKMLNGRQLAWLMYENFRVSEVEGSLLELDDFMQISLVGDNLFKFDADWTYGLENVRRRPDDETLESLYKKQLEKSHQLKSAMSLYKHDLIHNGKEKSYERLRVMVRAHLEDRKLQRNKEEQAKAITGQGPGVHAANQVCRVFKKYGSCPRGTKCPWPHDQDTAAPRKRSKSRGKGKGGKGDSKGKDTAGGDSAPRGRSEERDKTRRPSRGKSPSGKADKAPCRNWAKGSCTKGDQCDFWHPRPCKFYPSGRCDAGKDCVFPHIKGGKAAVVPQTNPAEPKAKSKAKAKGSAKTAEGPE